MLTVRRLMITDPYTIQPDASLREAIATMKVEGYRQLPVIDEEKKLLGIITDRDIRLAMNSPLLGKRWLNDMLLDNVLVESCMTSPAISVNPDTPAYEAAEMLSAYKFGGLPVVEDNKLVGIITISDFLEYFAAEQQWGAVAS